ncbi:hypothetical protein CC80DRAFT_185574 [Byssothecium circinans]|uniref:CENP-V/GFA domain-containing protein n=1 Tax=Byssothecium circinans TaxID=147558 RepID=A0A6A5TMP1_9PLEO|nr:hypothetical protein CC80DRAFT_185574 [Byssothecium circinans]
MTPENPTTPPPSQITGGCLCASIRYTIRFPTASSWPPYCSSCQCTQCRKALGSLHPIALTIPLANLAFHFQNRDKDKTADDETEEEDKAGKDTEGNTLLRRYESSPGCERTFCARCGSSLTFRNFKAMPETLELWVGTLDEEVLIGRAAAAGGGDGDAQVGGEVERQGGYGSVLCDVKETLFWGHRIDGVTDGGSGARGKKWSGMIGVGESFV